MKRLLAFLIILLIETSLFAQGTWIQKANFTGTNRAGSFSFSIGAKGYVGGGYYASTYYKDFWEWDQASNTWTQQADFGGGVRALGVGFSIGSKGYAGTGFNVPTYVNYNDLWEYDPSLNIWTQQANLPTPGRANDFSFSIGNKGYIGGGYSGVPLSDLWEYDALSNSWTQRSAFPGSLRACSSAFSIGNKAYVVAGHLLPNEFQDLWEWDQASNAWTQLANLPGPPRGDALGFSVGNYGYFGTGVDYKNKIIYSDFWQYSPIANSWSQMAAGGGGVRGYPFSFTIGCRGYIGAGFANANYSGPKNDFWEFIPPVPSAAIAGVNTLCAGDSTSLFAAGGLFFQWSTGETTASIDVKPPVTTTYSVVVFDACGADTAAMTVTVIQYPVISVSYTKNLCGTGEVQFADSSTNGNTWYWNFGDGDTSTVQSPSHVYTSAGQYVITLTVSPSPFGCTKTTQLTIDVPPFSELYIPNAFSPNGDGYNDTYFVSGSCISQMELKIFNRWGEKVFETNDWNHVWDGNYKGEQQNAGVYMYSFKGILTTGEEINKNGNITLMR